jgi:uncharacterized protein (TIGR02246 family)
LAERTADERNIYRLYESLLTFWNRRDADGMARLFGERGSLVGFDGSQADGAAGIGAHLQPIFADHPTAAFVARVREVRQIGRGVALLRAIAGMVPPGKDDVNPAVNAVQSLVAVSHGSHWEAALFQSTPAALHGRPDLSERLTEELRGVVQRGATVEWST